MSHKCHTQNRVKFNIKPLLCAINQKNIIVMKKQMSKLFFIGVVLIAAYCSLIKEKSTVETLLLDNVEALASGEGGDYYRCYSSGSIDCHGHKVEYMIDGMNLD